jgi:hypothetical protein
MAAESRVDAMGSFLSLAAHPNGQLAKSMATIVELKKRIRQLPWS